MIVEIGKHWRIYTDKRGNREVAVCPHCGTELKNLNIKAVETGTFYCSSECAVENVRYAIEELNVLR